MATYFYNPRMYAAEREIAAYLQRLLKAGCQHIEPVTDGLSDEQPLAVVTACKSPVSLLYGSPGTGKTTTSSMVLRSFDKANMRSLIVAPTGAAAKRSDKVVNSPDLASLKFPVESKTIHRALEYNPSSGEFEIGPDNPFDYDAIFMDETSMTDCPLMAQFLAGVDHKRTRLVFCGDPYQLPSVGPGNVMNDLIYSDVFPKTELIKIHRQGEKSGIAHNAARILRGEMITKSDPSGVLFEDFYFVSKKTTEESLQFILDSVSKTLPAKRGYDSIMDIQVLSPGKKSEVGVREINNRLREILNPPHKDKPEYEGLRLGDKVINRKNIKQLNVVNGDVGRVVEVKGKGCTVDFGTGSGPAGDGFVDFSEDQEHAGGSLQLAYCLTIHSSQGSEYKAVLIPCHQAHYKLLFRNLIYTGITRGKALACVVGDIGALTHAIETSVTDQRQTGLKHWLRMKGGN